MKQSEKAPWDIRQRTFAYALRAIKLFRKIHTGRDPVGWVLGRQYLRSATAIGASIEEAQSGESRADFIHKYGIAQKEARKGLYWLRLFAEAEIIRTDLLAPLIRETEELVSVITTIIVRSKKGNG